MNLNISNLRCLSTNSIYKNRREKIGVALGISVLILDLKSKESFEYPSISEAARSLNTYPKAI